MTEINKSPWRPISTAPKDGSYVLLYGPARGTTPSVGRFTADEYAKRPRPFWSRVGLWGVTWDRLNPPTHWMPLPLPPEPEDTGGGHAGTK